VSFFQICVKPLNFGPLLNLNLNWIECYLINNEVNVVYRPQ